jgi:S-adenosylmethionine:tRNA ribosyltransferase-isomerase
MEPKFINISDYDYSLPDGRIAKYPLPLRTASKLLIYNEGKPDEITESIFAEIGNYLPNFSLLVVNNTKVARQRLLMNKDTGASIEILCLEPVDPDNHQATLKQKGRCVWNCYVGNLNKWKEGFVSCSIHILGKKTTLTAEIKGVVGDMQQIEFVWNNDIYNFGRILEIFGSIPIPPYLNRKEEMVDFDRYSTVYADVFGSVAAPTAGFHFTEKLIGNLDRQRGIYRESLTLHVGAGTFKPVKSQELGGHDMHSERFFVSQLLIENLIRSGDRTVAVGTTTLRAIESLYYIGTMLSERPEAEPEDFFVDQWTAYDPANNQISPTRALQNVLKYMRKRRLKELGVWTKILIAPGYEFKYVHGLITNFHQPRSTLLLLVSAFTGNEDWKRIYEYALSHDFRFLSYGDSSLLLRDSFNATNKARK